MQPHESPVVDPCDVCGSALPMRPVVTVSVVGVFDASIEACPGCGFRQIRPRLDARELRALYPDAYFDPDDAMGFANYAREQQRSERDAWWLARAVGRPLQGARVLEVGCALGFLLDAVRRQTGAEVHGLDVSELAVEFTARTYGLPVRAATLEEAGWPDRHFDVVIQKDLLEHVLRPRDHLRETWRVLKPGGILWLVTPNGETNVRPLVRRAREEEAARSGMRPVLDQGHLSFFSRRHLQRLFDECGFDVLQMRTVHLKRGLRALGYWPGQKRKERLAPAGRTRAEAVQAASTADSDRSDGARTRARIVERLAAAVRQSHRSVRSQAQYFRFRQMMKDMGAIPLPVDLGLDFDCLLRRRA